MKEITLTRFAYTPQGTFGKLDFGGENLYTVERPWLDNKVNVSCVPEGLYKMELGTYHRGGYAAYELLDVPGRSEIKLHIGNTMNDLAGCIAPGLYLTQIKGKWAVGNSKLAYERFMEAMSGEKYALLHIKRIDAGTLKSA